jgi:tripartite-type tricarboxylate transporter receptor subunit TctC
MSKYTLDTEVEFYAGLGYVSANRDNTETLEELGLTEEELEEMTDDEVEDYIHEQYETWLSNHLDAGWYFKEED